jgi:hypothetical protein
MVGRSDQGKVRQKQFRQKSTKPRKLRQAPERRHPAGVSSISEFLSFLCKATFNIIPNFNLSARRGIFCLAQSKFIDKSFRVVYNYCVSVSI